MSSGEDEGQRALDAFATMNDKITKLAEGGVRMTSKGEDNGLFGPTIEDGDLPPDVDGELDGVIADLEQAGKATALHRARVAAGLALFGATVMGSLFGWNEHADAVRVAGAVGMLVLGRSAGWMG